MKSLNFVIHFSRLSLFTFYTVRASGRLRTALRLRNADLKTGEALPNLSIFF